MNFWTIFFACLLANIITVGCNFAYNYWRARQQRKVYIAAIEKGMDGFERLMADLQKDEQKEVRH